MKDVKKCAAMFLTLFAVCFWAMPAVAVPLAPAKQDMVYDKKSDQLNATLVNAPLLAVLSDMARQSGLEIKADPKVDRLVTDEFKALPLATAVDRLTAKLNVIKQFRKVAGKDKGKSRSILVGLVVLPEGQTDASAALSLLDADKESAYRASLKARGAAKNQQRSDMMTERWDARVEGMDDAQRARYEKKLKEETERAAALQAKRDKSEQQALAKKNERDARQLEQEKRRAAARGEEYKPQQADPEKAKQAQKQFAQPKTPAVIEN